MRALGFCVLYCAMGFFSASAEEMPPALQKAVDEAAKAGGRSGAAVRLSQELDLFLQPELADGRLIAESLEYMRDNGDAGCLPSVEHWLNVDLDDYPFDTQLMIRGLRPLASECWYEIKKRECKTEEARKALGKSLLNPSRRDPALLFDPEFLLSVLNAHLPESREWLKAELSTEHSYEGFSTGWLNVIYEVLCDRRFALSYDEMVAVFNKGGEFGRVLVASALMSPIRLERGEIIRRAANADEVRILRQFVFGALAELQRPRLVMAACYPAGRYFKDDPEVAEGICRALHFYISAPITEDNEDVKSGLVSVLSRIREEGPPLREKALNGLREFVDKQSDPLTDESLATLKRPKLERISNIRRYALADAREALNAK